MTLCDELAEEDPEFSTLTADGFDKAIIGAGQICGNMTVVYDLEKVYDILVEMGMTREDAVEYYCYNIAGSCGADMPLFMDVKVLQGDDIALRGEIAAIRTRHEATTPVAGADTELVMMHEDRARLLEILDGEA